MANGKAPRPPKPRKPAKAFKQAAPKVTPGKGLGTGLGELLARAAGTPTKPHSTAGRPKPVAIQRPPTSRVRRALTAEDLFAQTSSPPVTTQAVRPLAREVGQGASSAQELLELTEGIAGSPQPTSVDDVRLLSPTRSSNPARPRTLEISYNIDQQVLRVVFRDGGTYDYFGVPRAIYGRLARVKSPGKFIDANIKGAYAYEKVAF